MQKTHHAGKIAAIQQSFVSRMVASHLLLSRKRVSPSFTSPDIGHVTILDLAVSQLSALQVLRIATSSWLPCLYRRVNGWQLTSPCSFMRLPASLRPIWSSLRVAIVAMFLAPPLSSITWLRNTARLPSFFQDGFSNLCSCFDESCTHGRVLSPDNALWASRLSRTV